MFLAALCVPGLLRGEEGKATKPAFLPAPATPVWNLPDAPATGDIRALLLFEERLATIGEPTAEENAALAAALKIFFTARAAADPSDHAGVDLSPLEAFLRNHPGSAWKAPLLSNLGILYYRQGRFSQAIDAWRGAWDLGKDAPGPQPAVDRALGELARMYSRLGMMDEIEALLAETDGRTLTGAAKEMIIRSREALWQMKRQPEESFKCGPFALDRILAARNPADPAREVVNRYPSTSEGTSLAELDKLAESIGLGARLISRSRGSAIPVPSVVHWKLGHFGALVEKRGTRYLLRDSTFVTSQWIEASVIDDEASGHFLVPGDRTDALPDGWRELSAAEAEGIRGKGDTGGGDDDGTSGDDPTGGGDDDDDECPVGLARWTVHLMLVSLNIRDTPLIYFPPRGPVIDFTVNYSQREMNQPMSFGYANLGPRWNFNWISTLTFGSDSATIHNGTGGSSTFPDFSSSTTTESGPEPMTSSRLVRVAPGVYRQILKDGSARVFGPTNGAGRWFLTQWIDPQGDTVTLGYDAQLRLVTITDAIGRISTLEYEAADPLKITRITDPAGRTARFDYDEAGRLETITDAVGMTSSFEYGAGDDIVTLITGYGSTTFATHETADEEDDVLSRSLVATYPDGSREKWEAFFSASPLPAQEPPERVPAGMPVRNNFLQYRNTFHWDRQTMAEAPGDYTKAHVYHWNHGIGNLTLTGRLLESEKPPLESRIWYSYKGQANPSFPEDGIVKLPTHIGRVLDDGSTQLLQYDYNSRGNVISTIDPVGRTTLFFYDPSGTALTAASQSVAGRVERLVTMSYDGQHRPLSFAGPDGQVFTFDYTASGQVGTITDPAGGVTTFGYDGDGFQTSITGPGAGASGAVTITYDEAGLVETSTDALGYTIAFGYDGLNRLISATHPDATQQRFEYDLLNLVKFTDRRGLQTEYTYDSRGRRTSVTDPLGLTTRFEYCRCGSLSSLTDPLGRTTEWAYDLAGRNISKTYSDGSTESSEYDSAGRLISVTDARGAARLFQYDKDDQLRVINYTGGQVATPSVTFAYDPYYPRIVSITDGTGRTTLSYQPMESGTGSGNLLRIATPLGTLDRTYDELGRVQSRSTGSGTETFAYDALGRRSETTNALGTFSFTYLGSTALPETVALPGGLVTRFDHSIDRRVERILHERADASPISEWKQTYNEEGQLTEWTRRHETAPAEIWTPAHDAADRLIAVSGTDPSRTFAYTYDPAGNRLSETIGAATANTAYNSLNELVSVDPSPAPDRSFVWDAENRLVEIGYGGGDSTRLVYDGFGRCARIVEISGGATVETRQFLWDGLDRIEERDAGGNVTKRFFEEGVQLLAGSSPGRYFYTRDHLGSIRELVAEDGTVRARYDYDPFGRRTRLAGDFDADFGFTGHFFHDRSGLYLTPYRAYDPAAGRWISRDPLQEIAGANLYAYVSNDPLNRVDPLGLFDTALLKSKLTELLHPNLDPFNLPMDILKGMNPCLGKVVESRMKIQKLKWAADELRKLIDALQGQKCPPKKQLGELRKRHKDLLIEIAQEGQRELFYQSQLMSSNPKCD